MLYETPLFFPKESLGVEQLVKTMNLKIEILIISFLHQKMRSDSLNDLPKDTEFLTKL